MNRLATALAPQIGLALAPATHSEKIRRRRKVSKGGERGGERTRVRIFVGRGK